MERDRLPKLIAPVRLAKAKRLISGRVDVADLERVASKIADGSGHLDVDMEFGYDHEGLVTVLLSIKGFVPLLCQRTLEVYPHPIDAKVTLSPVQEEVKEGLLPEHYEPFVLTEDEISPLELIEDELLLSLPIVPKKPEADKKDKTSKAEGERHQPFAGLDKLLDDKDR